MTDDAAAVLASIRRRAAEVGRIRTTNDPPDLPSPLAVRELRVIADAGATLAEAVARLRGRCDPAWWGLYTRPLGPLDVPHVRCMFCNRIGSTAEGVHPPDSECEADELDKAATAYIAACREVGP